ncbi:MAG TPA: diaminopimelate epimerase [Ferruginibacter sp.]|nr:diaminopimelate epimerase [Ferruginibacter sp.]HMP20076.1 diaminopimelate epimerase [Ferruginibacter sp.]
MKITFFKYQGTGNDFIILDNYNQEAPRLSTKQIKFLCDRHFGIGADGLMYLSKKQGYDFAMEYYNADGYVSSMCGNGGRCLVKFAYHRGIHRASYRFIAIDGEHEAEIETDGTVSLKMKDVDTVDLHASHAILNTGSPHFVKFADNVQEIDVLATARDIRYSEPFKKEGINVNFVETIDEDSIYMRTYERGVEDETLSCGTGVTAAALLSAHNDNGFNTVNVKTRGGRLSVEFDKVGEKQFKNIWLCGPAEFVFQGEIELQA